MDGTDKRALAAGFSRALEAARAALEDMGCATVDSAADGASALAVIERARPDLVLCDAILPGMDGIAFAERVRRLPLEVQPALLLIKPAGMRLPGEDGLHALGVFLAEGEADAEDLARALRDPAVPLPPEKAARLEALLNTLGVPRHPGRECLSRAVALAWADRRRLRALRACLYPAGARATGLTGEQVERAIRHVIDVAWREGAIGQQHRIFGDTIDARRGKPTCGEMIARLADILRWEGRP